AAEKNARKKAEETSAHTQSPVKESGKTSFDESEKSNADSPGKPIGQNAGRSSLSAGMASLFSKKTKKSKQEGDAAEKEGFEFEPEPKQDQDKEAIKAEKAEKPKGRRKGGRKSTSSKPEKLEPDDGDVCFGLSNHPGTKALHTAIVNILPQYEDAEWSPQVYKAIRSQIQEAHFFIRTEVDAPWKEATANQRIFRVRQQFELSQRKRRMKIGEEALA
ncbi:MAG: hypothetical protein SGBAC_012656, partial [Bacillariaceae sp.]